MQIFPASNEKCSPSIKPSRNHSFISSEQIGNVHEFMFYAVIGGVPWHLTGGGNSYARSAPCMQCCYPDMLVSVGIIFGVHDFMLMHDILGILNTVCIIRKSKCPIRQRFHCHA